MIVDWNTTIMSRIGSKSISVPSSVSVTVAPLCVSVKGKCGELMCQIPDKIAVSFDSKSSEISVSRDDDSPMARSLHGLVRTLIHNMVVGVNQPWQKRLEIVGVGYQASLSGTVLTLNVGYANPLIVTLPKGVKCEVIDPTHLTFSSADKQLVGQLAANVRSLRKPEPYKGKGIRYSGEIVRRKSGKAFGS